MRSRNSEESQKISSKLKSFLQQKTQSMIGFLSNSASGCRDLSLNETWARLERRLWLGNGILFLFFLGVFAFGCSATKRIATTATDISNTAATSKDRFATIESEATASTPNLPLIESEAVGGQADQAHILSLVNRINETLPSVEDQAPYWMILVEYGLLALILIAVAWILWSTGIGSLLKRLIGFVPRAKRREAELARAVMDDNSPATVREYVAVRRATDKDFDEAYKRSRT